jgi:chitodextrinase
MLGRRTSTLVTTLVLTGSLAALAQPVLAAPEPGGSTCLTCPDSTAPTVAANRSAVLASTADIEAIGRAVAADPRRSKGARQALVAASRARRAALLTLAHSDPKGIADLLLPDNALRALGSVPDNGLEKKVTLRGSYTVLHREDAQGRSTFTPQVVTSSGPVSVYFSDGQMPHVRPGADVVVNAYQLDQQTAVAYAAGSTSTSSTSSSSTGSSTPVGPLNVAVIMANFSDSTTTLDASSPKVAFQGSPGNDVDSWYAESSYGKSSLNPSFFGPYTISDSTSSGTCPDLGTAGSHLLSAASPYLTYSQYRRIILIFNCTGYGASTSVGEGQVSTPQGSITGALTTMDVSFLGDKYGFAHELAHNLGNYHAAFFACEPSSFVPPTRFDEGCSSAEYGDEFDTLGATLSSPRAMPHLDPLHTSNAGWFSTGNDLTVSAPGTYTYKLLPYETPTSGLLALTIPRGASGTALTLAYRQPVGFDSWMSPSNTTFCNGSCTVTEGPSLELVAPESGAGGGSDTQAIDTTPNSITSSSYYPIEDNRDGALLPGKTFTDPEYGISVTTQSADSTGATVTVTVPSTATCTRQAPTVSLFSPSTQSAAPGQSLTYTLRVTSNDTSSCPAQRYKYLGGALTGTNAAGQTDKFTAVGAPDAFSLTPGSTTDVAVTLRPDATVLAGAYSFSSTSSGGLGWIQANSLDVADVATPNVTFQVTSPSDSTAPSAPSGLTANVLGSAAASMTWSPSTDNVGVAGYRVLVDNAWLYYTAQPSFFTRTLSAGTTHTVSVQAFDRQGNLSPTTSVSVTVPAKSDTTAPVPPGDPTASVTDRSVSLSWAASSDNAGVIGYLVSPFNAWVPAGTTTATFSDLATSTTFDVHVQAVDGAGNMSPLTGSSLTVTTAHPGTVAPTRPAGLLSPSATATSGVQLSWTASTDPAGVSGYYVYRNGRRWATVSSTSYTDPSSDLYAWGACYQYAVVAYDAAGNTSPPTPLLQTISPSTTASDTTAPTGTSLTAPSTGATVSGTATLSVAPSDNVGVSHVEFFVDGKYAGQSTASPYQYGWNTTGTWNGTHSVYARAYDSAGNYSTASTTSVTVANGTPDTVAPSTPSGLTAAAPSATQVNLSWTASTDNVGVTGYSVYRNGAVAATTTGTSWSDPNVTASTSYTYAVVAFDAAGNASPASSTVSVSTPAATDTTAPTTPTNLAGTAVSATQINLTWTAATDNVGVASYTVYRNGATAGTTSGTSWSDTGRTGSTTYSYTVVAVDAAGNAGPMSGTVSVTTSAATTTGAIGGTVTSKSNGAPLANVKISITVNGVKQSYSTSSSGTYSIPGLPAASYTLTFSVKGAKSQSKTASVTAGQTTTINVSL